MINEEGGIDPEQFRMEAMFDRMDAIGKGILGLTIQCAQCHSHKYDPITQEEYYRLFAFLNNDHEAQPVVYTPEQLRTVAELSRRIREVESRLRHTTPDWRARIAAWEESVKDTQPRWVVLAPTQVSEADTRFIPQEDGSLLAQGYAPAKFTYDFEATSDLPEIRAFRLELLTDPNLPANGPGRSFKGTCTLTEFRVEAADAGEPGKKGASSWSGRRPTTRTRTATWSPTSMTGRAASGLPAGSSSPSTARMTRPGASMPAPAAATPTARRSSSPRRRSPSPPGPYSRSTW